MSPFITVTLHLPFKLNICFLNCSLKVSLFTKDVLGTLYFPILQGADHSVLLNITRAIADPQNFLKVLSTLLDKSTFYHQQNQGLIYMCLPAFTV